MKDTSDLCGALTRRGYNQTTPSGRPFWSQDPRPEDVRIEDLAASLARICRFNGALRDDIEIYSVAQHSILASLLVPPKFALEALLHDAAEAYLGDMIKPIKRLHPGRKELEARVDWAIRTKFGLPLELSPEVKEVDYQLVWAEHHQLQPECPEVDWGTFDARPLNVTINPMGVFECRDAFLRRFQEITYGLTSNDWIDIHLTTEE